jgi:hypothetical protein
VIQMRPRELASIERARFGPLRTLNVRVSLLSGEESARRVESWLRSKQVELSGDVLIITGRGAGSIGGIPVIKESTQRTLSRLRRAGVIQAFGEDTAGSFVVQLAPLRALLEAPLRRKGSRPSVPKKTVSIQGLKSETRDQLRYLAGRAIDALDVKGPTEDQILREMERHFSIFARTAPMGVDTDRWLTAAISRALTEYSEEHR